MTINSSPDAKRLCIDNGAGAGPIGDYSQEGRVQTKFRQQQEQQETEGDNIETDHSATAETATQASQPSMTAQSQDTIVLCENESGFFGAPENGELHKLLGSTPEPNQTLHLAVEELRTLAITNPATIGDEVKKLAVALAEDAGGTHDLPLVTWKDNKDSARLFRIDEAGSVI